MKYILICKDTYGLLKGKTVVELAPNEIEITEKQYNTIQCPCIITLNTAGQLDTWEKCELPDNLFPLVINEKSPIKILEERLLQLEIAEVNRKSKEIEQQILGGI